MMVQQPSLRRAPIASAQQGLSILSHGVSRDIMRELVEAGPLTRPVLAARLHASSTKVHECLARLQTAKAVTARRRGRAPEYSVTECGRELYATTAIITRWFSAHPGRPLPPSVGWRAVADLGESWRMVLVEWIVRCAPTVEDLTAGFGGLDQRRLTEMLEGMEAAGMVALRKGRDGCAHYRLTAWAARAIGILATIARWEQVYEPPGSVAIEVDDAVVAILATLPLVRLPEDAAGIFTFTAETEIGPTDRPRIGTVWARVRGGRVVELGEGAPPGTADGWASGPFSGWLGAALDGRENGLRYDGRGGVGLELVRAIVAETHAQLALYG